VHLSLAILCSPSLQGILLHPWRCGQLDGAAAAGDLRMAIGRGGRGWRRRRGEGLGAMAEGMSVRDYFGAAENDEGVSLG